MDGIETAKRIRCGGLPPGSQPIIMMLTSDDLSATLARAKKIGIKTFLIKPIKRGELLDTLQRALGKADVEVESVAGAATAPTPDGVLEDTGPLKILLADDSADNRLLIGAYLKKTPYSVEQAEDGQAALDKVISGNFDLILMDIQMPVMDGYVATRKIREWEAANGHPRTPIIALTAAALEDAVRKALDTGCDAHVAKPVKKLTLLTVIRETMRAARAAGRKTDAGESISAAGRA